MDTVQIQEAPSGTVVKNLPSLQGMRVRSLGWADSLEKKMVIHTSILACEIPWAEEPGGVLSTGWQRAGQDLVTKQQQEAPILCQPLFIILKQQWKQRDRTSGPRNPGVEPLLTRGLCLASGSYRPAPTTPFSLPLSLSPKPQVTAPPPGCSFKICPLTAILSFLFNILKNKPKNHPICLFCVSIKTLNVRISPAQKVTLNKTPPAINEQFVI